MIDCFNNIIEININSERYYRAGHFATNKNGDLIIEYSSDGKNLPQDYRLFYALKQNGRGFFDDCYMGNWIITIYIYFCNWTYNCVINRYFKKP